MLIHCRDPERADALKAIAHENFKGTIKYASVCLIMCLGMCVEVCTHMDSLAVRPKYAEVCERHAEA